MRSTPGGRLTRPLLILGLLAAVPVRRAEPFSDLPQLAGAHERLDASAPAVGGAGAEPMYSYSVRNIGDVANPGSQAAQDLRRQAQTMYVAFYYANAKELKSGKPVSRDYIREQASRFEADRQAAESRGEQPYVPMKSRFEGAQTRTLEFLQSRSGDIVDGRIDVSMDHYTLPDPNGKTSERLGMKTEYRYAGQDGKEHAVEVYRYAVGRVIPSPVSLLVVDGKPVLDEDGQPKLFATSPDGAQEFSRAFDEATGSPSPDKERKEGSAQGPEEPEESPDKTTPRDPSRDIPD